MAKIFKQCVVKISKKTVIFALIAVLLIAAVTVTVSVTAALSSSADGRPVIVIDAGHGGRDGGVSGAVTNVTESEINLKISKKLRANLENIGYRVVMTRENMDGLYGNVSTGFKNADLKKRREIIEATAPDLVISIHQNSFPLSSPRGAKVFYAPKSEEGKQVAEIMLSSIGQFLPNTDKAPKAGDYFILQCTEYPSILIECGFLSNPEEEKLLITDDYQNKIAYAICAGTRLIMDERYKQVSE